MGKMGLTSGALWVKGLTTFQITQRKIPFHVRYSFSMHEQVNKLYM